MDTPSKPRTATIGSIDDFLFSDESWIIRWAVVGYRQLASGRLSCFRQTS